MNSKIISIVVLVIVVLFGFAAVALMNKDENEKQPAKVDESMVSHNNSATSSNKTDQPTQDVQETNQVVYKNFEVVPKLIKVKKGTTVTWTNEDTAKHDVTPDNETDEFKASELFGKGETYSTTLNTVGTYTYFCSPHPYMKGTIEVVE